MSKLIALPAALLAMAVPAHAQDHKGHADHQKDAAEAGQKQQGEQAGHEGMDHKKHEGRDHEKHAEMMRKGAATTLDSYRAALVARDAEAMTPLFAENSRVFENGKDEGSFANYLAHHIGPELDAIESFTFTNPTLEVEVMGHMALGRETYRYDIKLKDGREIAREGVASSVLRHGKDGWKILRYHSSSRAPR